MAEQDFQEKEEEPTQKRLEKAREEGQVAKSREVGIFFFLLASMAFLSYSGERLLLELKGQMAGFFVASAHPDITADSVYKILGSALVSSFRSGLPVWLLFLGTGIVATVIQGGASWSPKALALKWDRISPAKGFGRIFSSQAAGELVKHILKIAIVMGVTFWFLKSDWESLPALGGTGVHRVIASLSMMIRDVLVRLLPLFLILAILDYGWQKFSLLRKLRMSRAEVKEEFKESEGDPQVRQRIRSIQRAMARRRMMARVKKATVVITNPTHFAIAILYDMDTMAAPVVVAKGQDEIALNMRRVAREAGVPVVENPPLARTLYAACPVDREIPFVFYQAVAQVLSVLYEKGELSGVKHG